MTARSYPFPAARRVKPNRTIPQLGVVDQLDDSTWLARTLDNREFGPFRYRSEASEALLLATIFPDIVDAHQRGCS